MLHIHHSNQLEKLATDLLASYKNNKAHPFTPRIIISESQSLSRWLRHQFCISDGIVCLLDTPLPATWLWNQARKLLDLPYEDDPFSRERMQWLIFSALKKDAAIRSIPDMKEVDDYLNDDKAGLKRWQLAGRIADCFDRYQYYRPELIRAWSANKDNQWQAQLWRQISHGIDNHRVALMDQFLQKIKDNPGAGNLPKRLDLFSIHNLPKLLLDAYMAMADSDDVNVHIWLLSPTAEYWADLKSAKNMANKRLKDPDEASYWQEGNPLLVQWGQQGQVFQDMLLEYNVEAAEYGKFHEPLTNSLLDNLHTDIAKAVNEIKSEPHKISEGSFPSVQIHVCHGPMRECHVLRDNLLNILNNNDQIQPEDILVMVPEISRYAPYIKAIFSQKNNPVIPFNLHDTSIVDEHPLTTAFLNLLNLPQLRFTRSEILDLINIPEISRRFNLDNAAASDLTDLFEQLRVYWGFDKEHKQTNFSLPAIDENTWHQAFQRIMTSYALGSNDIWKSIVPATQISPQKAELASQFYTLLQTLRDWSENLNTKHTATEWAELLGNMINALFYVNDDEDNRIEKIYETLAELKSHGKNSTTPISLAVIRHWLNEQLGTQSGSKAKFYSGGITFCGMKPLRGVPFKVIYLMGMNEQAFPHRNNKVEFDAMHNTWRHGDPNPANEDRYLFLESLLATRQNFIISYTGRNIRNNDKIPPSVVVQELIDYINSGYQLEQPLITQHPLQPFSSRNFESKNKDENNTPPGFDEWWFNISSTIQQHERPHKNEDWPEIKLKLPENFSHDITVDQLSNFISRPIRQFIQKRLKLYDPSENKAENTEPFKLDGLQKWNIKDHFINSWIKDNKLQEAEQLSAEGMLPHGGPGEITYDETKAELDNLFSDLQDYQPLKPLALDINITIKDTDTTWNITGRINNYYEGSGLIHITASKFKPRSLLKLWIEHLFLQMSNNSNSHLYCIDKHYELKAVDKEDAENHIKMLLALYKKGLTTPLAFIDKPSFAYANQLINDRDNDPDGNNEKAITEANKSLKSTLFGDSRYSIYDDEYYSEFILRHHAVQFDDSFQSIAEKLMLSLIEYSEEI